MLRLTPELRAKLEDALREDIENDTATAVGSCGYLNDLDNVADGTDLERTEIMDAIEYFQIA